MTSFGDSTKRRDPLSARERARLPVHEHVLDRLAELLFDADELLDVLRSPDAEPVWWIESHVQHVYDEVNTLMKKLSD